MKTLAIAIAAIAMTFGAATQAEARGHDGGGYRTTIVVTGRDHRGRPVYAERYFIRMNAHGRALFGYRPVGGYGGGYDRGYGGGGGYGGGYDRGRDYRGGGGDHRHYDRGERHRR